MPHRQMRTAQLIAPFGPGSLYTDRDGVPHVVCGLDFWYMTEGYEGLRDADRPDEFRRFEPRLLDLLKVDQLRVPPDYRHVRRGGAPPPNAGIHIPAHRFPTWYRHTKSGQLKRFNLHSQVIDRPHDGGRWQPVRFVAVCDAGHLCDFPWKEWIGCTCEGDGQLELTDLGGSELSSIRVTCRACKGEEGSSTRTLAGVTQRPATEDGERSAFDKAGIACPGERPWLGNDASQQCDRPLIGALINQTNLYFARTASAIRLPEVAAAGDQVAEIMNKVSDDPELLAAKVTWDMGQRRSAVTIMRSILATHDLQAGGDVAEAALERLFAGSGNIVTNYAHPHAQESSLLQFRRAEFNVLRQRVDNPKIPDLRVVPSDVPESLSEWIDRIHLVERLKETRAFYGFDRLEPSSSPLADMPHSAMIQLFRSPPEAPGTRWLPAIEVFGEGIYFELSHAAIAHWQERNKDWLKRRLNEGFIIRMAECYQAMPPATPDWIWASRYLLIHTLSHILINRLVFECGYSTASLRERLYVSADEGAPMAGALIYTAAGDSEGTLGGLVRVGYADRFEAMIQRALVRASWCSADPICSENLGGQGSRLANLAACHSCTLLPETACETVNHALDRAMVLGTPDNRRAGALSELVEDALAFQAQG